MTTTHHPKTIVAAIVAGALALAAPAGASVLNPVTDAYNPASGDVQTVNATVQHSDVSTQSNVQTVNATLQQSSGDQSGAQAAGVQRTEFKVHPNGPGPTTTEFTSLRRDGSQAEPFVANLAGTPVAQSGDGFDLGDAAIGAGAGLLAATVLMLGSGAIGSRRHGTSSQPGGTVSQGA